MGELDAEALYLPSLVEMTARRLRAEILSGELEPGQRLVEPRPAVARAAPVTSSAAEEQHG